jgi:hypothetical protein
MRGPLVESVVRTNLRLAQAMLLVESSRAFVELRQQFLRELFDVLQQGMSIFSRAARQSA